MFNDAIIVQSAVSAFNNAALAAPAFLWWGILAVPLFVMTYMCGNAFLERIGWGRDVILGRVALATVFLTWCWVVLFSGNYSVLRDSASTLPFMVAAIGLAASLFIGSHTRGIKLPAWRGEKKSRKLAIVAVLALLIIAVGMSDMHAWWGPLLQIGAIVLGFIVGRVSRAEMRVVPGTILVLLATATAMLMQPEFFRFGQLGSLTIAHLVFLMLFAIAAAATIALRNINPRGRVHRSAYIKLKWMARFLAALGVALFVLTESVPLFLGTAVVFFALFALSVWHAEKLSVAIGEKMFAITIGLFGIITTMPAITALGILYWISLPMGNLWHDSKFLL